MSRGRLKRNYEAGRKEEDKVEMEGTGVEGKGDGGEEEEARREVGRRGAAEEVMDTVRISVPQTG